MPEAQEVPNPEIENEYMRRRRENIARNKKMLLQLVTKEPLIGCEVKGVDASSDSDPDFIPGSDADDESADERTSGSVRGGKRHRKGERESYELQQRLTFQQSNPKQSGSKSYRRYEQYKRAKTVGEALEKGMLRADLRNDVGKGYARFLDSVPETGAVSSTESSSAVDLQGYYIDEQGVVQLWTGSLAQCKIVEIRAGMEVSFFEPGQEASLQNHRDRLLVTTVEALKVGTSWGTGVFPMSVQGKPGWVHDDVQVTQGGKTMSYKLVECVFFPGIVKGADDARKEAKEAFASVAQEAARGPSGGAPSANPPEWPVARRLRSRGSRARLCSSPISNANSSSDLSVSSDEEQESKGKCEKKLGNLIKKDDLVAVHAIGDEVWLGRVTTVKRDTIYLKWWDKGQKSAIGCWGECPKDDGTITRAMILATIDKRKQGRCHKQSSCMYHMSKEQWDLLNKALRESSS
jgi:hypothetical protein